MDTHQKTILSDDWGVGIASLVATVAYQPEAIANTGEWLKRSVDIARAMREPKKRGPAKSPDFVFEDAHGHFHLVEAKGTQEPLAKLEAQISDGRVQKNNITFHDAAVEGSRLVIGTRVPLESAGRLEVIVADPPLDRALPKDRDRARAWLRRVGLAGACRAAGLPSWAEALLNVEGFSGRLGEEARRELKIRQTRNRDPLVGREMVLILPRPLEGRGREWRLVLGMPATLLFSLLNAADLDAAVLDRPPAGTEAEVADAGKAATISATTPNSLYLRMEEI